MSKVRPKSLRLKHHQQLISVLYAASGCTLGVKKRTINHPILQDNYSLVLILKQRRWRCINPDCHYSTNESFKFVNKSRRMSNATEMLIVSAYKNLMESSTSIAKRFNVSDTFAHEVFNRYVKIKTKGKKIAYAIELNSITSSKKCTFLFFNLKTTYLIIKIFALKIH